MPFVWFALSFQEQVEKYGVYVGIASFFGLALLSVLYFSQALELTGLREVQQREHGEAEEGGDAQVGAVLLDLRLEREGEEKHGRSERF